MKKQIFTSVAIFSIAIVSFSACTKTEDKSLKNLTWQEIKDLEQNTNNAEHHDLNKGAEFKSDGFVKGRCSGSNGLDTDPVSFEGLEFNIGTYLFHYEGGGYDVNYLKPGTLSNLDVSSGGVGGISPGVKYYNVTISPRVAPREYVGPYKEIKELGIGSIGLFFDESGALLKGTGMNDPTNPTSTVNLTGTLNSFLFGSRSAKIQFWHEDRLKELSGVDYFDVTEATLDVANKKVKGKAILKYDDSSPAPGTTAPFTTTVTVELEFESSLVLEPATPSRVAVQ